MITVQTLTQPWLYYDVFYDEKIIDMNNFSTDFFWAHINCNYITRQSLIETIIFADCGAMFNVIFKTKRRYCNLRCRVLE